MRGLVFGLMGRRSVGQMGHNFGWVTWVMGHSMLNHDPLPFTVLCLHFTDLHKLAERPHIQTDEFFGSVLYKCKINCCFITMCKAHSKVTHIKQQKYFHHLKRPGYNTEFLLYPRPFRWWKYLFLKMAAATAKYYFRFRICWCHCLQKAANQILSRCHCLQKVKVYQQTKFCRHISTVGWDINYFRFWKTNVRYIGN